MCEKGGEAGRGVERVREGGIPRETPCVCGTDETVLDVIRLFVLFFVCLSFVVFSFKSFSFRDVTSSSFLRVIA